MRSGPAAEPEPLVPARPDLRVVPTSGSVRRDVVVVGGGIAGLAAAHMLANESRGALSVTLLEASEHLGGKLLTSEVAGVPVDEGAEALLAARPEAVNLARAVGLERDLVHPDVFGASIWTGGRLRRIPPNVMGIPTDLRALAGSQLLSLPALLRLPLEYGRPATRFEGDVSVGAFVESRLGREVVETLVEPLLGGVYAGRADALSLAATVPALFRELRGEASLLRAAERTSRGGGRRAGARSGPVFAGIRGGVGRLAPALADDLTRLGVLVRTDASVRSIHRVDDLWRIIVNPLSRQEVIQAHELVLAVPPHQASTLLAHICPPAANDLGLIDMSSMAIVTLAYPAAAVPPLRGSGFLVPPREGRRLKAATYSTSKWDWLARAARTRQARKDALVLIRASVGRFGEEGVLDRDDRDLIAEVHGDLADAVGLSAAPVDVRVTRWKQGIPQYATGHPRRVSRIRAAIAEVDGLEVCGAAFDGVGIAAVIGSAHSAARNVIGRLDRTGRIAREG